MLDNPPFSILTEICRFYLDRKIKFFLFAPSLTVFSGRSTVMRMNHIFCDADITYENGAIVRTAFVTSYGADTVAQTAPKLGEAISAAMEKIKSERRGEKGKYSYPDHVLTAAMLQKYSKYGIKMKVYRGECEAISALDEQRKKGKKIYGGGLLLSERAAAERAAAERAAAEEWGLSPREREIVAALSKGTKEKDLGTINEYKRQRMEQERHTEKPERRSDNVRAKEDS